MDEFVHQATSFQIESHSLVLGLGFQHIFWEDTIQPTAIACKQLFIFHFLEVNAINWIETAHMLGHHF